MKDYKDSQEFLKDFIDGNVIITRELLNILGSKIEFSLPIKDLTDMLGSMRNALDDSNSPYAKGLADLFGMVLLNSKVENGKYIGSEVFITNEQVSSVFLLLLMFAKTELRQAVFEDIVNQTISNEGDVAGEIDLFKSKVAKANERDKDLRKMVVNSMVEPKE